jgi:hypothetical protein
LKREATQICRDEYDSLHRMAQRFSRDLLAVSSEIARLRHDGVPGEDARMRDLRDALNENTEMLIAAGDAVDAVLLLWLLGSAGADRYATAN